VLRRRRAAETRARNVIALALREESETARALHDAGTETAAFLVAALEQPGAVIRLVDHIAPALRRRVTDVFVLGARRAARDIGFPRPIALRQPSLEAGDHLMRSYPDIVPDVAEPRRRRADRDRCV